MAVRIHGMAGDSAKNRFSECAMLPTDMTDLLGDVFKNSFGL
jgi:NAD(P)H-hydrate repair Nnr-like enzyme with NAD(P)H-hydrate dehydratase domain